MACGCILDGPYIREHTPAHTRVPQESLAACHLRAQVFIGGAEDLSALHVVLWSEFDHVLKNKRPEHMLLLSEGGDDDIDELGGVQPWLMVTAQSDLPLVIERASLKLIERPKDHTDESYDVAFPVVVAEPTYSSGGRSKREKGSKGSKAAGLGVGDGGPDARSCEGEGGGNGSAPAVLERFTDDLDGDDDDGQGKPLVYGRFADDDDDDDDKNDGGGSNGNGGTGSPGSGQQNGWHDEADS